jgi:hypothetical protein
MYIDQPELIKNCPLMFFLVLSTSTNAKEMVLALFSGVST